MGYLTYDSTGIKEVDELLGAIEKAGKAFHHTDQWDDEIGEMYVGTVGNTPNEWIQNKADALAKYIKQLKQKENFICNTNI